MYIFIILNCAVFIAYKLAKCCVYAFTYTCDSYYPMRYSQIMNKLAQNDLKFFFNWSEFKETVLIQKF